MPISIMTRIDRLADAKCGIVSERDGTGERTAVCALALRDGERGGDHGSSRVERGSLMNVVELQNVRRDAVGERRGRRGASRGAEDGGLVARTETAGDTLGNAGGGLECAGERRPEPVESCPVALVDDRRREVVVGDVGEELGEGAR